MPPVEPTQKRSVVDVIRFIIVTGTVKKPTGLNTSKLAEPTENKLPCSQLFFWIGFVRYMKRKRTDDEDDTREHKRVTLETLFPKELWKGIFLAFNEIDEDPWLHDLCEVDWTVLFLIW